MTPPATSKSKEFENVLVTGGAGYIGSHVASQLIENGYRVFVLDNLTTGHRWAVHPKANLTVGNVGDFQLVQKLLKDNNIKSVLHFAANIEVPESVANPLKYYRNNTGQAVAFLEACIASDVERFIFSSTAAVYGMPTVKSITETTPQEPINPYGRSKLFSEHVIRDLGASPLNNNKFRYVILRYFNVAGAKSDGTIGQATPNATHLLKVACETTLGMRKSITVFGTDYDTKDGTCIRDYIHVDDLASAHILSLGHLEKGGASNLYNCGYGHGFSVKDVLDTVQKISGTKIDIQYGSRRAGDPDSVVADSTKIRKELGWTPKHDDLSFICKTALDWEKKLLAKKNQQ